MIGAFLVDLLLCPKDPADGHGLEENAPDKGEATGGVEVHQLEHIDPSPGDHGESQQAHEDGHGQGELLPVGPQLVGPVVHQAGHERLRARELAVDAQRQQHHEEESGPEGRGREGEHNLRIDEEGEAGAWLHHVAHLHTLGVSHVPQDGEDDCGREEACEGVDGADDEGVPVAVVMELVVAAQRQEGPDSHPVGVEDLSATI